MAEGGVSVLAAELGPIARELSMTATEAWLTIVTATVVYGAVIAFSRVFGQRQFAQSSTYDLAFVFALGSIIGRVVLVRTSLATALLGLGVMFVLHAGTGWLHHHSAAVHKLVQNPPILVVAHGEILDDGMRRAHMSEYELYQSLRSQGRGSLADVQAAVLERNGNVSFIGEGTDIDPSVFEEVVGREHLRPLEGGVERDAPSG